MQVTHKEKATKKWKRSAREGQLQRPLGKISSPLQRLLAVSKSSLKATKSRNSPPLSGTKRAAVKSQASIIDALILTSHRPSPNQMASSQSGVWSRIKFGNIHHQIEAKNRKLDRLYKHCGEPVVMNTIRQLERVIEGLLECDELYWKQRSMVDWFQAGDRNSKYFNAKAWARKKKNYIACLVDAAGCSHVIGEGMARTVKDYFSLIFLSSNPSSQEIERATSGIKTRLSDDSTWGLSSAFTGDEVGSALFMGTEEIERKGNNFSANEFFKPQESGPSA
ncbi:hypothetical protein Dsin_014850 [Dipteronia sinensis]|uniref:Uncharacterized protein n=1 Tax=Dipteronia sinensis TaxID=43782 RepID=A0AAE0ANE5_9ROSI|nr:hypothetical protein Dsin_014850 [Dipteronia sinensis]